MRWRLKGYQIKCSGDSRADHMPARFFQDKDIDYENMLDMPYTHSHVLRPRNETTAPDTTETSSSNPRN